MLRHYFHKTEPPAEGGKGQDNNKKEGDKAEEFCNTPGVTQGVHPGLHHLKLLSHVG
jgi:hypothetical protein